MTESTVFVEGGVVKPVKSGSVYSPWMNAEEAATFSSMNFSEFKALAARGEIPRHEVRPKRYRYYAPELAEWLKRQ